MIGVHLREYPVNNPICERMVAISQQILFVDVEIMVRVQLPELQPAQQTLISITHKLVAQQQPGEDMQSNGAPYNR